MAEKQVLRFQVPALEGRSVELPNMAKILQIQPSTSGLIVNVWVEVNQDDVQAPGDPTNVRHFRAFKTGEVIPDGYSYVGSAIWPGQLAVHIYEFVGMVQ